MLDGVKKLESWIKADKRITITDNADVLFLKIVVGGLYILYT